MGTEASASQRCRGRHKIRMESEVPLRQAQGERHEMTRWGQTGAHNMCDRGEAKIKRTDGSAKHDPGESIKMGTKASLFLKVSDITKITLINLRNEVVKNFTRAVGGIVKFRQNKKILVIYVQSVIFASFDHAKEERI